LGLAPEYVPQKENLFDFQIRLRNDDYQNTLKYFRAVAHQSLYNFELYTTFWKEYNQAKPLLIRHYKERFGLHLEKATDYADNALSHFVERAAGTYPKALLFGERDEDLRDRRAGRASRQLMKL